MEQAGPPVIFVDEHGEIVHLSAAAWRFLAFNTGELTSNLLRALHLDLRVPLSTVLESARLSQRPESIAIPVARLGEERQAVRIRVSPLNETWPGHLLIAIEAHPVATPTVPALADDLEAAQLRSQLADLQTEHDDTLERHQADTEELRVAMEELAASQENFQSLNEELNAANGTLKEKIAELGCSNSDLQNLVAATQIATVFLDRELCVTRYTPAAAALFRLKATDVGRPLTDMRHYLDHPGLEQDASRVLGELQTVEREVCWNENQWFLVRLLPYRTADDRIVGLVLTCVNVTERREAEAHRQAKEAAERINAARSEFLSRMSHELRTPLNAILGFGQIMELDSRDEKDTMALGLILKAGRHLLSLVDEVLDLSRAEAGELRLALGAVDLGQITRECMQLTARSAEARGVACEVEAILPELPPLWTDEQRLRQVLLNLLSNAIKYNRPGGRVTLSCGRIAHDRCRISVRDTGGGIAPEDVSRLFTPFERLHHAHGEVEGTGLGLAITRRLVEALGGSISVESRVGRGSRFSVELPLGHAPALQPPEDGLQSPSIPAAEKTHACTLLCIEDNASNLQLIQMVAARHWPHWRLLTARDGTTGLEQARQHAPGLVLLDLQLPDCSGDQVLAELRRDPRTAAVPVVVLSADASPSSRERLLVGGAAEFLTKPFQIDDLVRAVNRMIRSSVVSGQEIAPGGLN